MVRITDSSMTALYAAARQFVDEALRSDGSLFTPGTAIWSKANLNDLYHRFVEQPDESSEAFELKLKGQLEGAPAATIQLMAEVLFVHLLAAHPKSIGAAAKRNLINNVLSWSPDPVTIPKELERALNTGIASTGTLFLTGRFRQLEMLLEFMVKWKDLSEQERGNALADPWAFKALVQAAHVKASRLQEAALLHLVHPDTFEPILSGKMKQLIVQHFRGPATDPTADTDRQLAEIRAKLTPKYGKDFQFYSQELKAVWWPRGELWERFTYWARQFYQWEGFEEAERTYKEQVAQNLRAARDALLAGSRDWIELLRAAFKKPNNLTPWQMDDSFNKWVKANPEAAASALRTIWDSSKPITERINGFKGMVPGDAYGGMVPVITSFLLMGDDPYKYPIFRRTAIEKGYGLVDYPLPPKDAGSGEIYQHALGFFDAIIKEAKARGLELRDRLDAQGLIWAMVKAQPDWEPMRSWDNEKRDALLIWRGEDIVDDDNGDGKVVPPGLPNPLGDLADELFLDKLYLEKIERLLKDKGQVVFYGPPGTGKTYVAQKLARHYAGDRGTVEIVQFHPSYAYEDFVEGYRPNPDGSGQGFTLVSGPLKRIAEAARKAPEAKHVLVIDEINRGNVAKVFGELYFLLEYRNEGISLLYGRAGDEKFSLPRNLWIIGTMNTADRSIALIDAALRRRFYFVPFFPDEEPIRGVLRKWLGANRPGMEWVANVVDEANRRLGSRHAAIGPSYFMKSDLSSAWVELIWEHAILPYLAERFYGNEEALNEFDLAKLRAETVGVPTGAAEVVPGMRSGDGVEDE